MMAIVLGKSNIEQKKTEKQKKNRLMCDANELECVERDNDEAGG